MKEKFENEKTMSKEYTTASGEAIAFQQKIAEQVLKNTQSKIEEEIFRRGYSQGFYAARLPENESITYQDVRNWRDAIDENNIFDFPIGSYQWHMEKQKK